MPIRGTFFACCASLKAQTQKQSAMRQSDDLSS
jgi:hypothetical protein